ncbi:MAG: Cna B-type domain-containing protein, partial [Eubacteriales bacterium]|nr:Cna B-type domain-containing protein [Eubacteriales bacterium]
EDAVPGYIGKVSGYNVTNTITSVPVRKVDIAGGTVLEGAALQVLDKDGNVVAEWVSEAKDYVVEGLLTKTPYTLHEVSAPEGYELAPDTKFQLKEDGTVEILDKNETATVIDEEGRLVIGDKRTETVEEETVSVTGKKTWNDGGNRSKKRPEKIFIQLLKNGEPMEGQRQEVTVTDKDEGSWSFDKLPKYDENGKEIVYSIREDAVPGYIGKVSGYNVTNTITSVPVRKVDIAGGTVLEGAALQVLDKDGNVVAEWVSEAKDYVVEGLLTETPYTLHEVKAPEGYGLAPDTVFWLNDDGTVNVDKGTAACENGVILVEDKYVQTEDTSVSVVKTVSYNGLPLVAEGISFYVGLYYDEGCTKMAAPYKEIRLEKASSTKVTFDNLEVGRTYYVGECDNKGNMISSGEVSGVVYQAKFTGTGGNRVVTSRGENVQVALDNQMAELPDGFYIEGQLHVTKKVLNVNGKPMNTSKVFYAGIFEDAGHTKLSSLVENNILTLAPEGTSEAVNATTVAIPDKDAVVKLYVAETDASGKPVAGTSGFSYEVTVTGEAAVLTVQNSEAYVSITNRVKEKIHEKEKIESKSENNKKTKNTGTSGKAKTSDNTPILPMAVLFLLSVSGAVWILYRRRRSQK